MTNQLKGLAALKQFKAEQEARAAAANRPKANWFSFPDKKTNVAVVRFLQELDPDAENFDPKRGVGQVVIEHKSPNPDFRKQRRALCTLDQDENQDCYACERHAADRKAGWGQKTNLYINVLYTFDPNEAPKVGVLSRNFNSAFVSNQLMDEAVDENTITAVNYRITRSGDGPQTQWTLKPLKGEPFDDSGVEVFDLDQTAIISVAYNDQPKYYGSGEESAAKEESEAMKSVTKSFDDEAW